ncbi:MAG: paraquat-inducible membrane protein A, partial [gamma proteobacterium symbiont of Stewartia floridana]
MEIPLPAARRLMLLLLLSSVFLIAGLWLPMLTLTKFLFIANSFSVISGVVELYNR